MHRLLQLSLFKLILQTPHVKSEDEWNDMQSSAIAGHLFVPNSDSWLLGAAYIGFSSFITQNHPPMVDGSIEFLRMQIINKQHNPINIYSKESPIEQ